MKLLIALLSLNFLVIFNTNYAVADEGAYSIICESPTESHFNKFQLEGFLYPDGRLDFALKSQEAGYDKDEINHGQDVLQGETKLFPAGQFTSKELLQYRYYTKAEDAEIIRMNLLIIETQGLFSRLTLKDGKQYISRCAID